MRGFAGFSEVRRELQKDFRQQLVNLAVEVDGFKFLASREYVTGRDLATGRAVRASLADYRTFDDRPTLADRCEQIGPGGVLVLIDCWRNRNGFYEAFNAIPFASRELILTDGLVRVTAPLQRENGTWGQSIQHLRTAEARRCETYTDVVDAALAALAEPGAGRAGAMVRGWHAAKRGLMSFEIARVFDPMAGDYLGPEASFDSFLQTPDVFVSGLNTATSGERCMEILGRLMSEYPGEVVWEVIPKRTYSMGGVVAEAAGLGTRRDPSLPYRTGERPNATGCLPSIVGLVEKDGVFWPRIVVPQRADAAPVPPLYVATRNARPTRPAPRPYGQRNVAPDAISERESPSMWAIGARAGKAKNSLLRQAVAEDPMADIDAPPPLPPHLDFSSSLASGADNMDLSAFDGIEPEDVAVLARLDALAAELKGLDP